MAAIPKSEQLREVNRHSISFQILNGNNKYFYSLEFSDILDKKEGLKIKFVYDSSKIKCTKLVTFTHR